MSWQKKLASTIEIKLQMHYASILVGLDAYGPSLRLNIISLYNQWAVALAVICFDILKQDQDCRDLLST